MASMRSRAAALACALAALAGCATGSRRVQSSDYPFDFHLDCLLDSRHVVLFIVDGLRADVFDRMVEAGDLPAIGRHLVGRGARAEYALAPVPSITNASIAALTCGAFPGRAGVVGNRWFDHEMLRRVSVFSVADYYAPNEFLARPTVFEALPDEPTATIATPSVKGSAFNVHLHYNIVAGMNYLFGKWDKVDEIFMEHFRDVAEFANREGVFPRVTIIHLSGLDFVSHKYGQLSPEAAAILRNVDEVFGRFAAAMERNGALDSVCLILLADHGHVRLGAENFLLLDRRLSADLGIPVLDAYTGVDRSGHAHLRERHYDRFAAIVSNNGRNAFLHLRHNPAGEWVRPERMASWEARPAWDEVRNYRTPSGSVDLVEALRGMEGIRFVIGSPRPGEIAVFSAGGEGRIRAAGDPPATRYAYEVVRGDDPLGCREDPAAARLMDGRFHPSRAWLEATARLPQPDVVAQLPSLFESPFCGDLFLVAADDWDFEEPNVSSHGGFLRGEMAVPLVIAGPRVRRGRFGIVRLVDVVPTILDYLGLADRVGDLALDGVSFLEEIEDHARER
ncbi:MAG: alkaline phosphatase family protein [bacterium]|nr:alkaline phosphatase family protein [bacterium]